MAKRSFFAQKKLALISWFGFIGLTIHFAWSSEKRNTRENMQVSVLMCFLFLTLATFNTSNKHPYSTIGNLPAIGRGIGMTLCCILIFILCNNYEDARNVISILEKKPTQAELNAYLNIVSNYYQGLLVMARGLHAFLGEP